MALKVALAEKENPTAKVCGVFHESRMPSLLSGPHTPKRSPSFPALWPYVSSGFHYNSSTYFLCILGKFFLICLDLFI